MSSLLSGGPNLPHPVVEGFGLALRDKEILGLIEGILTQHVNIQAAELQKLKDEAANATNEATKAKQELAKAQARIKELEGRSQ